MKSNLEQFADKVSELAIEHGVSLVIGFKDDECFGASMTGSSFDIAALAFLVQCAVQEKVSKTQTMI